LRCWLRSAVALRIGVVHADYRVKIDPMESLPRVLWVWGARHSASEREPANCIRGMAGHRAGDGENVSVGLLCAAKDETSVEFMRLDLC
jgi:hypothetical protein